MSIPPHVVRCVMSGEMPNGEIWSSGFWLRNDGIESQTEATALAEAVYSALAPGSGVSAINGCKNYLWNSSINLDTLTVYVYNTGGLNADFIGVSGEHNERGAATGHMPNQVSAVLSLRSGVPGRRNRGRMYLPASGCVPSNIDSQIPDATLGFLLDGFQASFQAMQTAGLGVPSIVSTAGTASVDINLLIMDSKFDIQRRRANSESILRTRTAVIA